MTARATPCSTTWLLLRLLAVAPRLPLVFLAALTVIALRRPFDLIRPEFIADEAGVFYVPTLFAGPELIVTEWGGYLHVLPRLGYELAGLVPPLWAPLADNLMAMACFGGVAVYIASPRFASVVPQAWARTAIALGMLLAPASSQVMGTLLHLHTLGALWLATLVMLPGPTSRVGRLIELVLASGASLSGPFSIILAPLFWWRARRSRHAAWLAAIVTAGAIVQAAIILGSGRTPDPPNTGLALLETGYRMALVPLVGETVTLQLRTWLPPITLFLIGSVVLVAVLIVAWRYVRPAWPLAYLGAAVAVGGFAAGYTTALWDPMVAGRYFYLFGLFAVLVVGVGVCRRSPLALGLAPVLALGIVADFMQPVPVSADWPAHYRCIGSPAPCDIPIAPGAEWTVLWPGLGGDYQRPAHPDAD